MFLLISEFMQKIYFPNKFFFQYMVISLLLYIDILYLAYIFLFDNNTHLFTICFNIMYNNIYL